MMIAPPRRRRLRPLLIVLVAVGGVAVAASLVAWRVAVGRMQTEVARWASAQQAQGWTISYGTPQRRGWPLAAELSLPDVSVSGGAGSIPGGIAWRAAQVTLRVSVAAPGLATLAIGGQQHLRLGPAQPVSYAAERCTFAVPLSADGTVRSVALDAASVRFADGTSIGLLQGQFDTQDPAAAAFRLTSEAIAFPPPPARQPPLGGNIASATVSGAFKGAWPRASDPQAAAAQWQASGGAVALQHIALGWGPLGVTGSAALALNAALQPDGSAHVRIVGYDATLSALAAGQLLTPRAAQAAGAVLALMARTPDGGGAPQVEVPLTLHDGTLAMGRIPLARVPQLVWPTAVQPATLPR